MARRRCPLTAQQTLRALLGVCLLMTARTVFPDVGLTSSWLWPRAGRFSHPVSPLSLSDAGFRLGRYLELSGSLSLYGLRGLGLEDAGGKPLRLESPPVGPALSVQSSIGVFTVLPIGHLELKAGGGLFGCWIADPPVQTGPIEDYLAGATYEALTVSLSRASSDCWGGGAFFGGSLTWYLKGQIGLALGARYYLGRARLGLSGSYDAYDAEGLPQYQPGLPLPAALTAARVDLNALELLLGVRLRL